MTGTDNHAASDDLRVLLVDDDADVRRAYGRILSNLGYLVDTVANGNAAVESLRVVHFDLLVTDIGMEGMNGNQLLRAVRKRGIEVPVILMTGGSGVEASVDAVGYGAFRFLTKPVDRATLADAVRGAIQTHVVAQIVAKRLSLFEGCRRLVRATCQGSDWDFATIWMSPNGERLRCTHTWSRAGFDVTGFEAVTRATSVELGRGLPGRVWASGSPEWVPDIRAKAGGHRDTFAVTAGFQSGFAVPFGGEGEVFAVLEFFSRTHRAPDLLLLEFFLTAGAQLGSEVLRERADLRAAQAETAKTTVTNTLSAIMECAPAFIIAVDDTGTIQFINKTLPHRCKEDLIGARWLDLMPQGDHEHMVTRLRRILATGRSETYETTMVGPEGGTLFFTTQMAPLRGNDRVVVIVAQEVTDLKRSQAEAAAAQRLATVGTLAAGVAHEINTPIQFVSDSVAFLRDAVRDVFGLLQQLQATCRLVATDAPRAELQAAVALAADIASEVDLAYLEENVPHAFDRCLDGLDRITTIVRSMKEFAHPDQEDMAPADLNRAIHSTLTVARSEYKYVADLECDFGLISPVTCHINDINQVVLNLVVNAAHAIGDVVKGTEKRGTIKVATRQDADHAIISVSDSGCGIPDAIAQRIFEPFFTTKEIGKGTGQGLALARTVVIEKHGGELTFESKQGEGTTFLVRLPTGGRGTSGIPQAPSDGDGRASSQV